MSYTIQGLAAARFRPLFDLSEEALAEMRGLRTIATGSGEPCRVSLEEAKAGERLLLVNHVSLDVETPFRTAYAIYVREGAEEPAVYRNRLPLMLDRRTLSLRAFDSAGMLRDAALAPPGDGDRLVRGLFERPEIAVIHAHNAAYGCFLARIDRA